MPMPKGCIVEHEKDGRPGLIIVTGASPEHSPRIAGCEIETNVPTVIDESEVVFAH